MLKRLHLFSNGLMPFDHDCDNSYHSPQESQALQVHDGVNAERAAAVGRDMQKKLDGQSVTTTMEVKFKLHALSSLKKIPKVNEKKILLDSLKFFNRLILSVVKAGYRFSGAAAPCSGVQGMYKLPAAAFAQCILLPTYKM